MRVCILRTRTKRGKCNLSCGGQGLAVYALELQAFGLFGYGMGWIPAPNADCIVEPGICLYAPCFKQLVRRLCGNNRKGTKSGGEQHDR